MTALVSPWHEGERAVQERVGVAERMLETGQRVIRSFMPDQHREFFARLPFILVGSSDRVGRVWASLLAGPPGFVASPDPLRLSVGAEPAPGDPLAEALSPGAPLGLLGIDLATRRRNRANGRILTTGASGFTLAVEQSFGNCPKYIVRRDVAPAPAPRSVTVELISSLDGGARRLIGEAATFFVASTGGADSLPDVSHRGGRPGFVRIDADGALTVPDYAGNSFFNTLGNFLVDRRAGLLFLDFVSGDLLQLAGTAEIIWDGRQVEAVAGAKRLWRFHAAEGRWLRGALPLQFAAGEISPFSPAA